MDTGKAFCAENTATTAMINNARIKMLILWFLLVPSFMIIPQNQIFENPFLARVARQIRRGDIGTREDRVVF